MAIVDAPLTAPLAPPTRPPRDRGIDLVRAVCVLGVVLLHAIMVGVTVTEAGASFDNASDGTSWIAPLSWLLQVMPLFFVIGGFSGALAFRRSRAHGGTPVAFVGARLHRLLRPAVFTIAIVAVALAVLTLAGVPAELVATAGYRYGQPLWFLGVFLLCQALLPVLLRAHERAPVRSIALLALGAVAVDVLRGSTGAEALGFLNLAFVWLTLQQLGFFLADGRIDRWGRRVRLLAVVGAVLALAVAFLTGFWSPDLIAHINPPTTALLLVGVAHTGLLSLHRTRLERWSSRPVAARFTAFVTPRAMTIYLWHMPVLLLMAGASAALALLGVVDLPVLDGPEWWVGRPLWIGTALLLTAVSAIAFARHERHPLGNLSPSALRVGAAVVLGLLGVVLLLVVGTTLASALVAIGLVLAALRLSRPTATRPAVPAGA